MIRMGGLGWSPQHSVDERGLSSSCALRSPRFSKSAEEVEGALKDLQAYFRPKTPDLWTAFVATGDKPLNQYERACFINSRLTCCRERAAAQSWRVTPRKLRRGTRTKDPAKSGYQVLSSNGRLELDLLDRLEEKFGGKTRVLHGARSRFSNSTISAPKPKLDLAGVPGAQNFRRRQNLCGKIREQGR